MTDKEKPIVVVLSRNYPTGLSVIRSLGQAGYTVDLVASAIREGRSEYISKSKYIRNYVEVVSQKVKNAGDYALLSTLHEIAKDYDKKAVLFPTDDYTAFVMDENREVLAVDYLMPHIVGQGDGSMTNAMDKTFQGSLAREAGLLTPKEWIIPLGGDEIIIPDDVVYPCFCKPIESFTGYKREMARCESEEELAIHLRSLRRRFADRSVLIQEFLEIETEIDFSGVCIDQEIIIPAIVKKTNVAQHEKGVTLAGKIVPFDEIKEIQDGIIKMLQGFHYVGMFDMEFNVVNGKYYFNEVNLRSGGPNYSYFKSGVNLPDLAVRIIAGLDYTEEDKQVEEYGKSFIYEKVAWDDHIAGFLTRKELDDLIDQADIKLLYEETDSEPGEFFVKEIKKKQKKEIKKEKKARRDEWIDEYVRGPIKKFKEILMGYPQTKRKNRRDPNATKPRVLVVGKSYSKNLSAARAVGKAGYEAEVLKIYTTRPKSTFNRIRPEAYSKYVKAYYSRVARRKRRTGAIITRLKKLGELYDTEQKTILIPTDDLTAAVIDERYWELEEFYTMPNIHKQEGKARYMMNRSVQRELVKKFDIPTLNGVYIEVKDGKFEIPQNIKYPCLIQPDFRKNGYTTQVAVIKSEDKLIRYLEKFAENKDGYYFAEDFVESFKEYSLPGVSVGGKVSIPALVKPEDFTGRGEGGKEVFNRIIPASKKEELIDKLTKYMASWEYDGLFDIQLIETEDGNMYFSKVRLHSTESIDPITQWGTNLMEMYLDYMVSGKPIDVNSKYNKVSAIYINEHLLANRFLWDKLGLADIEEITKESDYQVVFNDDDAKPYKHFKRFYKRAKFSIKESIKDFLRKIKYFVLGYPQSKKKNARDPHAEKPRVLVSGRNYCTNLTVARSLGEAGYDVEILRIFQVKPKWNNPLRRLRPEAHCKYVKGFYICVSHRRNMAIVNRLINLADLDNKMLLIPADDLVASIIDEYYDELKEFYVMPNVNNEEGKVNWLMSKEVQKDLAIEAGLPVARSWKIETEKGKFDIPEGITYPCFIKPNISRYSAKSRMRKIEDEAILRATIMEFSKRKDVQMLVEEFIEIDKEWSILGVSSRDGVAGPGFFVAEKGGEEEHRGVALLGRILDVAEYQEFIDKLNQFVGSLGFDGLYDIDLISDKNGKMYFVEVNMRTGASIYSITNCGTNLPGMFADYMFNGKPIDTKCTLDTTNKLFLNERILIDEYAKRRITKKERRELERMTDIYFIRNDNDKKPYRHFRKFYPLAGIMRFMYKFKEK